MRLQIVENPNGALTFEKCGEVEKPRNIANQCHF